MTSSLIPLLLLILFTSPQLISSQTSTTPSANATNATETTSSSNTTTDGNTTSTSTTTTTSTPAQTNSLAMSEATTTTLPQTVVPADNSQFQLNFAIPFCTCDLTASVCDVNCCCDSECSSEDRLVFTSCDEVLQSFQAAPVCVLATALLFNNAPYECSSVEGQCCVENVDVKAQNYLDVPALVFNENEFTTHDSSYSYASQAVITSGTLSDDTNYKSGDYLSTFSADKTKGLFTVPTANPAMGECLDMNPVKFLQSSSVTCRRHLTIPLSSVCATAGYLTSEGYLNTRFIAAPHLAVDSYVSESSLVSVVDISAAAAANFDPINNLCVNVVTQVTYTITHSAGQIQNVSISFETNSLSGDLLSLEQTFIVKFGNVNDTVPVKRSGNPGYIIGEPVLAGFLTQPDVITFEPGSNRQMTVLASTLNGYCNKLQRQPVTFGENYMTTCRIKSSPVGCDLYFKLAQQQAVENFLNESLHIASFGNAEVDQAGDWVKLLRDDLPTDNICNGLTVTLQFLYSKAGTLAKPQNRIVGANLKYEVQLLYTDTGLLLYTDHFNLVTIVSFLDVSESSNSTVVDGGLTIRDYVLFAVVVGVLVLVVLCQLFFS